jgi:hypothetical protein
MSAEKLLEILDSRKKYVKDFYTNDIWKKAALTEITVLERIVNKAFDTDSYKEAIGETVLKRKRTKKTRVRTKKTVRGGLFNR